VTTAGSSGGRGGGAAAVAASLTAKEEDPCCDASTASASASAYRYTATVPPRLVVRPAARGVWRVLPVSTFGAGAVTKVTGLAAHVATGEVYAADFSKMAFHVFSRALDLVTSFPFEVADEGDEPAGTMARPLKVAVDCTGARVFHAVVWACSRVTGELQASALYTYACDDGRLVHRMRGPGGAEVLRIGVHPTSGDVYVVTNPAPGEPRMFHVMVLSQGLLNLKARWPTGAPYGRSKGVGVAVDLESGNVAIADQEGGRVMVYTDAGVQVAAWEAGEPITSTLTLPDGYVTIYYDTGRVQVRHLATGAVAAEHRPSAALPALCNTQTAAFNPHTGDIVYALDAPVGVRALAAVTIADPPPRLV